MNPRTLRRRANLWYYSINTPKAVKDHTEIPLELGEDPAYHASMVQRHRAAPRTANNRPHPQARCPRVWENESGDGEKGPEIRKKIGCRRRTVHWCKSKLARTMVGGTR